MKTKIKWGIFIVSVLLCFSVALAQYIPPPPPSHIRFAPPQKQYYPPPQVPYDAPYGPSKGGELPRVIPPILPSPPQKPEIIDVELVGISKISGATQDRILGFKIFFKVNNLTTHTLPVDLQLVCTSLLSIQNFQFKPGKTRRTFFQSLQDPVSGHLDEISKFKKGDKNQKCSLNVANVMYEGFYDITGPTDSDLENNSFTFELGIVNEKIQMSGLARNPNNITERSKDMSQPLSEKEREEYKKISDNTCMNVLVSSEQRGTLYNGKMVDDEQIHPTPWIKVKQAHIAGDRLGYISNNTVIIDGEEKGKANISGVGTFEQEIKLFLNERHYAYNRKVRFDRKTFSGTYELILDGKNLGDVGHLLFSKFNGDYFLYAGRENVKSFAMANGKRLRRIGFINFDYDGKNIIYHDVEPGLMLNGKRLGFGSSGILKDGHVAYVLGKTENVIDPHVYYDGKDLGPGSAPNIEKDHIVFLRSPWDLDHTSTDQQPRIIYDGKEIGTLGGLWKSDLAGDHIAYVRKLELHERPFEYPSDFYRVNIDGQDLPGDFLGNVYVEIEEKSDRSSCNSR